MTSPPLYNGRNAMGKTPETIIHVDMDAFYASVEQKDNPTLLGKPVIVGGTPESRGVVSAASYEAREFGVRSAMPTAIAQRLCPKGVFLPVRMARYVEESRHIRRILFSYTPLVEPLSLDEAFLDVAGSRRAFGTPEAIGRAIKQDIRDHVGLTASVGIAANKYLAKLASDLEKPDGFVIVHDSEKLGFLGPLPVSRIWVVGKAACAVLHDLGARTIEDLRHLPLELLQSRFGNHAETLLQLAHGEDDRDVIPDSKAKSIGAENTFATDIGEEDVLTAVLLEQSEDVGERLRRHHLRCLTLTLKARYPDFRTITRRCTLDPPMNSTSEIYREACRILRERVALEGRALRLIGIAASGLRRDDAQLSLFDQTEREKAERLDKAVDEIREKMGPDAIKRGRLL